MKLVFEEDALEWIAEEAIRRGTGARALRAILEEFMLDIMSEASVKSYLIRGAQRNPALTYPNREFGYGTLDLFQTFLRLRE